MAAHRKYAALPDLDSAPDIYETPELTDDQSTIPPTTVRSPSDNEYDNDDDDDDTTGISRSRLRVDQARSKFMPANVDATGVDFSDRLVNRWRSYKTSTRHHRIHEDGTEEIGDLSDEDEATNLSRKIARLRREIEEAKDEYQKQKAALGESKGGEEGEEEDEEEEDVTDDEFDSLSKMINELSGLDQPLPARTIPAPPPGSAGKQKDSGEPAGGANYGMTPDPDHERARVLAKAAEFDSRLLVLEKALGLGSAGMPEFDAGSLPRAIIPLLENLHKQISTLSEASVPSLDNISRRVRALTQEAENLEKARRNAKTAQDALASAGATGPAAPAATAEGGTREDSEQMAKINALYGTLPTIENLTPLLPPLLDRLRSLRSLHAEAATAAETLASLEKKQAEMADEIQQWREGLEKVEGAVREGGETMTKNVEVISGWVKDLEERMAKLS